ncbi:type VI secretion system tip protein VgrG, partial [Pseudomonas sp. MWU12-2312b]
GDDPDAGQKYPHLEDYEYPGHFSDENTAKRRAARALERRQIEGRQAQGESDQPSLNSGHYLEITGHPRSEWNDLWLLTGVVH